MVVPNIKDINFWEQFTTSNWICIPDLVLFRISKISTFESNSQLAPAENIEPKGCSEYQRYQLLRAIHNCIFFFYHDAIVVPNIKDINFWEQFTTSTSHWWAANVLFRISKISTFESNSQLFLCHLIFPPCCSEYQRYQLLRAIHNRRGLHTIIYRLFRISKISTFESNSQRRAMVRPLTVCCSEYQRYQLLRAIHNE